uniref:Organic cation transporter isoform x1 n=1 Tax=Triatoma infestans TaxID=30076 RepID=A0A170Z9Y2_TRIIF
MKTEERERFISSFIYYSRRH